MFDSEWQNKSLFGWEAIIQRTQGEKEDKSDEEQKDNPLHCAACMKTFDNDNVFHHHKKGKRHIKSINKLSKSG
jgi:hypothetical protein